MSRHEKFKATPILRCQRFLLLFFDTSSLGSGVEYVPHVAIRRFRALGQILNGMVVLAHTLPPSASVDGLLGLDFFRGMTITIFSKPDFAVVFANNPVLLTFDYYIDTIIVLQFINDRDSV